MRPLLLICLSLFACGPPPADPELDLGFGDADASAPTTEVVTHVYQAEIGSAGFGPFMHFEVPADALSIQVQARGESRMVMAVDLLEAPDGSRLVDPDLPGYSPTQADRELLYFPAAFHSPNRSIWGLEHAVVLAPATPAVEIQPGTWRARLAVVDGAERPMSGHVQAEILIKRVTTPSERAQLTVNLHLATTRWTAAQAGRDPEFEAILDTIRAAFAEVDLEVRFGRRTQLESLHQAPAGKAALRAVFEAGVFHAGLNLFFLDRIDPTGDGANLAGLSGNVPGPNGWNGASVAGVLVATRFSEDPAALARVAIHEMGHYLGLFHTIEVVGDYTDQLEDTDPTPTGRGNLMYPSHTGDETHFSPDQGWVMRRSPSTDGIEDR